MLVSGQGIGQQPCPGVKLSQRQGDGVQPNGPALHLFDQGSDARWRQGRSGGLLQQRLRLVRSKAQVGSPDLDELALRRQAAQRQRRVKACAHDQMQGRRRMAQQLADKLMDRSRAQVVVVIQDQRKGLRDVVQFVEQRGRQIVRRRRLRRAQQLLRQGACPRKDALHRCRYIAQEDHQIIIGFVQGEPSHRPAALFKKLVDQRRLARAGRSHKQQQRGIGPVQQLVQQARTRHQRRGGLRLEQFGP